MKPVNLTPGPINIADEEGNIIMTLHPSGKVAKAYTNYELVQELFGTSVTRETYFKIVNLPEPKDGVIYIVSKEVARIAKRFDVISPRTGPTAIRKDGRLVAVRGFLTFA